MRWDYVLFDLDGTLTDPKEGITNSAAHALKYYGIDADPDTLTFFIGPPLYESFERFNIPDQEMDRAIERFREYFEPQGWMENIPYPGIADTLNRLQSAGLTLILATSKPEQFAKRIMDRFDLSKYFTHLYGAPMNERKAGKSSVISRALQESGIIDPTRTIMVGDRRHDVEGARANNIETIAALWGYGTKDELETAGAKYFAKNLKELESIILQ